MGRSFESVRLRRGGSFFDGAERIRIFLSVPANHLTAFKPPIAMSYDSSRKVIRALKVILKINSLYFMKIVLD